jgi:hypothetical protein
MFFFAILCFNNTQMVALLESSHKVPGGEHKGVLQEDTDSIYMWDRIKPLPCDRDALSKTSNKRQAKSVQDK